MLKKTVFILYAMLTFCGGQILKEFRGDLVIVISRDEPSETYDTFMFPVISEEFIYLTG